MKVTAKLSFICDKLEIKKGHVLSADEWAQVEPHTKLLLSEGCLLIEKDVVELADSQKQKKQK